jgi:RNA polymerase sigma-70 factor (ECF subfamily)
MTAELMHRAQAGDIDAFGELYAEYHAHILAMALKRFPDEAEDIAQDTFVRALRYLHHWRDQGISPRGWLSTIAANICIDRARLAARRPAPSFFELELQELEEAVGPDERTPELAAVRGEVRRDLRELLGVLSDDQRLAVSLRYLEDLPVREIARRMGRPDTSVKMLLVRGRARMRLAVSRG